jgi:hypothetical protein
MIPVTKNPKSIVFWNAFCQSPKDGHTPAVVYRTIGPYKLAHALLLIGNGKHHIGTINKQADI